LGIGIPNFPRLGFGVFCNPGFFFKLDRENPRKGNFKKKRKVQFGFKIGNEKGGFGPQPSINKSGFFEALKILDGKI